MIIQPLLAEMTTECPDQFEKIVRVRTRALGHQQVQCLVARTSVGWAAIAAYDVVVDPFSDQTTGLVE